MRQAPGELSFTLVSSKRNPAVLHAAHTSTQREACRSHFRSTHPIQIKTSA